MFRDILPLREILSLTKGHSYNKAKYHFLTWLEDKFGAEMVIPADYIPYDRKELVPLFAIARNLVHAKMITEFGPSSKYPDEPLQYQWYAACNTRHKDRAGGMSVSNDHDAFVATLAEAYERYLWFESTAYFDVPQQMSVKNMQQLNIPIVDPRTVVGFTKQQRRENPRLHLNEESVFWWCRGFSWSQKHQVHLPAQLVNSRHHEMFRGEPTILVPITTGLATWGTHKGAVLRGILEIVERDAFMITWLNQLTVPALDIESIAQMSDSLAELQARCQRYGLNTFAIHMPTDVPAYAVCAGVEDAFGHMPPITIGLKAHRNLAAAVEGALLEALRGRQVVRWRRHSDPDNDITKKPPHEINHIERMDYWGVQPEKAKRLHFLKGCTDTKTVSHDAWENDSEDEHLQRIISWARRKKYELASVTLATPNKAVAPWYVEMVVMPDLQPIHQNERFPYLGGERLRTVPKQFGYTPRETLFIDEPHPFA